MLRARWQARFEMKRETRQQQKSCFMPEFVGDEVVDLIANWNPKQFLYLDIYSVDLVEVTLDHELQGHYRPVKLTHFSLEHYLRLLD